jgi:serine/threonine protein kinase
MRSRIAMARRELMAGLPSEARDPVADLAHGMVEWPRIPGYQIEGRVGAGGMAVVFRAHDERLRRPVALKILAPALAADGGFRRRFIREARAAAMVDDPHIIPVFAAGESDGLLFIAMRFVAGGDVRSLLGRSGAMSPGRATGIVSAMGSALDAAHRAGLVHRDVKPANMLIDVRPGRPDHVYLSDFGLSKGALSSGGITRAGHVVGTPAYLAPEQASGGKIDGRTDQYSLACVAYELLTGVPAFPRDDAAAMVYAHLCAPPPAATAQQPSLPSAVDSVLARAMSKDPEQRFLTCQEFAESLRAALGLRRYDADPGTSVRDGTGDGASRHGAALPAVIPDDRDASPAPWPSGSSTPAGPSPASVPPGRAPGGESGPGASDPIPPPTGHGGRARTRRRVVLLSLTALALTSVTVAGVMIATHAPTPPEHPGPADAGGTPGRPEPAAPYKPVPGQLASVSAGPGRQLVAAGYACGECGTPAETDRPLIATWNGSEWSRLAVPGIPGSARLTSTSVSADGTIYAVGYACAAHCAGKSQIDRPLILRRRGGAWSSARPGIAGSARLTGVSVAPTGAIFAVGYTCTAQCAEKSGRPLILRSDGSRWLRVDSPSLRRSGILSAVSTQPDGDAWAAGDACVSGSACRTLILHWDGSAWSRVHSPSPGHDAHLLSISTTSAGGWASGWYSCTSGCDPMQTLILRWNGHSWSQVRSPSPPDQFNALYAISGTGGTAWAAGIPSCTMRCTSSSGLRTLILRWNGSLWSRVPATPVGNWALGGIATGPDGSAAAVGHACLSGCTGASEVDRTVILRRSGSRWSVVR